jgi:hypothetical protein
MLGFGTTTYDSLYILSYVVRSDAIYNAANYVNPKVDGLIDAIATTLVTYARDALIEEGLEDGARRHRLGPATPAGHRLGHARRA